MPRRFNQPTANTTIADESDPAFVERVADAGRRARAHSASTLISSRAMLRGSLLTPPPKTLKPPTVEETRMTKTLWTLVRHSGCHKPAFAHAVEEAPLRRAGDEAKVRKAGGLLFEDYRAASDAAMTENYPPEVQGLNPKVRGRFVGVVIAGRALYVPAICEHVWRPGTPHCLKCRIPARVQETAV